MGIIRLLSKLIGVEKKVKWSQCKRIDIDGPDFWDHYFPGYKKEQAMFDRDLTSLLGNQVISESLHQFGYDAAFLKNLMERLRALGNAKAM